MLCFACRPERPRYTVRALRRCRPGELLQSESRNCSAGSRWIHRRHSLLQDASGGRNRGAPLQGRRSANVQRNLSKDRGFLPAASGPRSRQYSRRARVPSGREGEEDAAGKPDRCSAVGARCKEWPRGEALWQKRVYGQVTESQTRGKTMGLRNIICRSVCFGIAAIIWTSSPLTLAAAAKVRLA